MRHIAFLYAAAFLPAVVPPAVHAAGVEPSIKLVETNDSSRVYLSMHENAPHVGHIPDVPRFALLGKEHKFYMGIGANIKAVGVYDFGHPIDNPNSFVTSAIPMDMAPGNGAQFKFSAQQSNVFLNIVALPGTPGQLGAYVAINFLGNGYSPSLQHAYLKYRGITAGYTYSIFTDIGACPATIDYQGPNGFVNALHGMISYERLLGKDGAWKAGIGIDMPQNSVTNASHTAAVSQRVPDIPFYIQRNWAQGNGWLRISGIVRNLYYRDLLSGRNIDRIGWGIKADGVTPVWGGLTAYYQGFYGKGATSYIQDLYGTGMDLMPEPGQPGTLSTVEAWSAMGALKYSFSPEVYCNLIYSHVRTYAPEFTDSSVSYGSGYRYAQYAAANVFWQVNSIVRLGAEYIYGRRVDYNGRSAHDNRLEALLQVSF